MIDLKSHKVSAALFSQAPFNDLGQGLKMDNSHRVTTNAELIRSFNTYESKGSPIGKVAGYAATFCSFGIYTASRRHTVPPGYFGHYQSSQRHKLVPPGIHTIIPTTSKWLGTVVQDDEANPRRQYGDKTILQVSYDGLDILSPF